MRARVLVTALLLADPAPASAKAPASGGDEVPPFGCVASAARRRVACVVGYEGHDTGQGTRAALVFAALDGAVAPAPIHLYGDDEPSGPLGKLAPAVRRRMAAAQRGFTAPAPTATLDGAGRHGAVRTTQVERSPAGDNTPPRYDVTLEHLEDGRWVTIESTTDAPVSRSLVRVYEWPGVTLVVRELSTAEEGAYGTATDAWLCRKTCAAFVE